jgi:DNA-binding MarR family transcriptional regulator
MIYYNEITVTTMRLREGKKMSEREPDYISELIKLYMQAASVMGGFRLPVYNPFSIEGDPNGRSTAIILMLGKEKTMKMSEVAERFAFSPSSATILIDRMVKQQLVKRVPQGDDRRIIQIALDAEGDKVYKRLSTDLSSSIDKLLSPLSDDEKDEFIKLFLKIVAGLKKSSTK